MSDLQLTTSRAGKVDVVTAHGSMTAQHAMMLHSRLELLLRRPAAVIVLDLAAVTACDITAVTVLRAAAAVAVNSGCGLRLARPPGPVAGILRTAHTLRFIPAYASLDAAIHARINELLDTLHVPAPRESPPAGA